MLFPCIQKKSIGFLLIFSTFSLCTVGVTFFLFNKTTKTTKILNSAEKLKDLTIRQSNINRGDIDTIYIDDYDKIIDDEKLSLKKIDYFEQIIIDHPVINDDKKLINLNKKSFNDDYDDIDDLVNSGSGDFINNDDDDDDIYFNKIKQKLSLNRDNFYSVSSEIVSKSNDRNDQTDIERRDGIWLETRARRIIGNVKKSEERSRQLLLCEEAGGGELCRMLFKGVINE